MRVGPYALGGVLGKGGMAEVREATRDGRLLALKWVHPDVGERAIASFAAEVRVMASLRHRGILPVLDHGVARPGDDLPAGAPWFVTPRARGSLHGWRGTPDALARWLRELLAALAWAHASGVVHRDVKPANLLVAPAGHLWLADFGVADALDRRIDGTVGGTWAYMAPERLEGERGGPISDLYSVGCAAHALWTGKPPFGRGADCVDGHYYEDPPRLDLPFADWIDRLLAKDPDERFPTAAHALAALDGRAPVIGPWIGSADGERLWDRLRQAVADGPRAVVVPSRALVDEVARAAAATAGVRVLRAVWDVPPAAGDGVAGLLARMGHGGQSLADLRAALADGRPTLLHLQGGGREPAAIVAHLTDGGPLPVLAVPDRRIGDLDVLDGPSELELSPACWPTDHPAFAVAAALGRRVDPDEWEAVCAALAIEVPWVLWERLRAAGHIALTADDPFGGWAFATIEDLRAAGPPSAAMHRACATVLGRRGAHGRAARHHAAVREAVRARALYVREARDRLRAGAPDAAERALHGALVLGEGADLDLLFAAVALERRRPREAVPHLERARRTGGEVGARAERDLGRVAWAMDADVDRAITHLQRALSSTDVPATRAGIHRHLGWMHLRRRAWDDAAAHLERGLAGMGPDVAASRWGLAELARRRGSPDAVALVDAAIAAHRELGARGDVATLLNTLGEVHRAAADRAAARKAYRDALDEGRVLGGATRFFPAYNLATLDLEDGRVEAGLTRLDTLLGWTRLEPWAWLEGTVRLTRVAAHVLRGDRSAFDTDLARGAACLDRRRGVGPELVALLDRAAAAADANGWPTADLHALVTDLRTLESPRDEIPHDEGRPTA